MNQKRYLQVRVLVMLFVAAIVGLAVAKDSYLLATIGVITGMIFIIFARSKTKIVIDEREKSIREKSAQTAYAIFAPTIGIGAFLLLFPSHSGLSVFSKGEFTYLESLGVILAYLTLFLIAIYALSYRYFNQQYTGKNDEK